jgi:PAS domain S-box-containing protein
MSESEANVAGAGAANLEGADRRLQHLYEVSKLLTRFETVEQTIPTALRIISETLPLRSAILILETDTNPEMIVWQAEGVSTSSVGLAKAHARTSYASITRSESLDVNGQTSTTVLAGKSLADLKRETAGGENFILLPLVVEHGRIFGAVQLEGTSQPNEDDLVFVNAMVNQLAISLDRHRAWQLDVALRERAESLEREQKELLIRERVARTRAELKEAAGEEAERRHRALVDNLDRAFVWEADATTFCFSYVSSRAEAMVGYPRERWLAGPGFWRNLLHPDDRDEVLATFRKAQVEGTNQRLEHRFVTADGQILWLHTGVHVASAQGAYTLQGVSVDITLLKEADERVRHQLDFTRAVTGSLGEGVLAVDVEGRITFFNPAAEQLLGRAEKEVVGENIRKVFQIRRSDGTVISAEEHPLLRVMVTGTPFRTDEHVLACPGHPALPVSLTSASIKRGVEVVGAVLAFQSILQLKRSEQTQRFLSEMGVLLTSSWDYSSTLSAVVRLAVPFVADVCFVDMVKENGEVQRLEVAFADPQKQNHKSQFQQFVPKPGWQTPQAKVLQSGESILSEELSSSLDLVAGDDGDGEPMRAVGVRSMMVVPLLARGRTLGALTFLSAESGRRYTSSELGLAEEIGRRVALAMDNAQLYRQVQKGVRAREELLAIVAHDLRNPLGVVLMNTERLLKIGAAEESGKHGQKYLEEIQRAAEHINHLTSDLLHLASIEAGQLSIEKRNLAVDGLVTEAVEGIVHRDG